MASATSAYMSKCYINTLMEGGGVHVAQIRRRAQHGADCAQGNEWAVHAERVSAPSD